MIFLARSTRRRLRRDERGVTVVEFALIAPALMMVIMGALEMGYNFYVQSQIQGAVQSAARSSSTQAGESNPGAIDARVKRAILLLKPDAQVSFSRKAYSRFADVHRPEDFTDVDKDGTCNNGDPFEDVNGNGVWDEDRAKNSSGGARDAVLYVVTVSYTRAFGVAGLMGLDPEFTTESSTVLRNQPWDKQDLAVTTGNCA